MVSSSTGLVPFGQVTATSGGGAHPTQATGQRTITPIRPNALINFNRTQPPTITSPSLMAPTRSARLAGAHTSPTCCLVGQQQHTTQSTNPIQPKALSPSGLNDSLPSQILPHLFVGNQEQTNRETVNKLNIKYILSLGLLPMIMANSNNGSNVSSPTHHHHHPHHHHHKTKSPSLANDSAATQQPQPQQQILMPTQNSSMDFKIRIRSNTPTTPTTPITTATATQTPNSTDTSICQMIAADQNNKSTSSTTMTSSSSPSTAATTTTTAKLRDENKGVKLVRSVYCKCINIADNSDQLLSKFFDEAYTFIEEARRKKCNILIHCLAGISRSPTIAIAYLMRVKSLHWKDAYDLVKQCRPQIDPNLNFMGQLRIYNKSLRDEQLIARKRNNGLTISDDCHTTIKGNKNNSGCCVNGNNHKGIVSHPSAATTTSIRDKDNINWLDGLNSMTA